MYESEWLRPGERLDDTGFGGLRVIQNEGFGYGVDSVLLASFAAGETGARCIREGSLAADLGTGSGIVAFILAHKIRDLRVNGIEMSEDAYSRASRACVLNGLQDRISFTLADILDICGHSEYDAVVTNPPYFRRGMHPEGAVLKGERYTSRHETTADIHDFVSIAASMLRAGGGLYMVHRPDRLADIIAGMRQEGIEPKTLQMVVPRPGEAPNIVLVHGIMGAGSELKVLPEIAVHSASGGYTDQILRLYERTQPG